MYKEKGSKFIGYAYPILTHDDINVFIEDLKKEHPKARHHCFAWRLGIDKNQFRASDDGEPSGTAGKPILGQIDSKELTNVLIVVVRYFGGTLLGASGLITAYRASAKDALDNAKIITRIISAYYLLKFEYPIMNQLMEKLKKDNIQMIEKIFDEHCSIKISVKESEVFKLDQLKETFENLSIEHLFTL